MNLEPHSYYIISDHFKSIYKENTSFVQDINTMFLSIGEKMYKVDKPRDIEDYDLLINEIIRKIENTIQQTNH